MNLAAGSTPWSLGGKMARSLGVDHNGGSASGSSLAVWPDGRFSPTAVGRHDRLRRAGGPSPRPREGRPLLRRHPGAIDAGRCDPGSRRRHRRARVADLLRAAARRRHLAGRRAVQGPRDPSRAPRGWRHDRARHALAGPPSAASGRCSTESMSPSAGGQLGAIVFSNGPPKTICCAILAGLDLPWTAVSARSVSATASTGPGGSRAVPEHRVSACRVLTVYWLSAGPRSRRPGAACRTEPPTSAGCSRRPTRRRSNGRWRGSGRAAGGAPDRRAVARRTRPGSRSPASWRPRPTSFSRTSRFANFDPAYAWKR